MALSIDRERLDEFCPLLFRTLDSLNLLPRQLRVKPNEFEKFPRLLFGFIRRYQDVEAGFREWESRVLRQDAAQYRKEDHYIELEVLRQWMNEHTEVFVGKNGKANLQHLQTSLYARVFQYLYPRRVLVNAYCQKHQGNAEALRPDFVARELPTSIMEQVQKIHQIFVSDWDVIVADARDTLLDNPQYYGKVIAGKEKTKIPLETIEIEDEEE